MKEREARAILFSAIEGGHPFWSQEIFSQGALRTVERLLSGGYDVIKYSALIASIKATSADQVCMAVENANSELLMPGDAMWPSLVDDLIAPPIALIAKGNLAALSMQSLAIVGTRNPTNYGARIAGDFAAGFVKSLSLLDTCILLDIYPARELPIEGVTSQIIHDDVTSPQKYLATKENLVNLLKKLKPKILLTIGAGDIDTLVVPIKEALQQ